MPAEATMHTKLRLAEVIAHAATSQKICVSVAVCDEKGRIFAFLKMDGTDVMSGHEAMRRAMTAAGAALPSELAGDQTNQATSTSMEGIGLSKQAGGLPLFSAGDVSAESAFAEEASTRLSSVQGPASIRCCNRLNIKLPVGMVDVSVTRIRAAGFVNCLRSASHLDDGRRRDSREQRNDGLRGETTVQ